MPPKSTEDSEFAPLFFILAWAALWPFMIVPHFAHRRHLRWLTADTIDEDIGSFARGVNRRSEPFDSWVVRATWDALVPYVMLDGRCIPVRPADRLVDDLGVDPDDIDFDLIPEVAARSRHSLDHPESNPHYGKIETLGDFVKFMTKQPVAKSNARQGGRKTSR